MIPQEPNDTLLDHPPVGEDRDVIAPLNGYQLRAGDAARAWMGTTSETGSNRPIARP